MAGFWNIFPDYEWEKQYTEQTPGANRFYYVDYKQGAEYVGAFRASDVTQPLNLADQMEMMRIMDYTIDPSGYTVQGSGAGTRQDPPAGGGGQWFPWLDDFFASLGRGMAGAGDFLSGQTGKGFWGGLEQAGSMALIGLGLIAVIVVMK